MLAGLVAVGSVACASEGAGEPQSLESYGESEVAKALGIDTQSDVAASARSTQQITHIEAFGSCLLGKGYDGFPLVYPEPPPITTTRMRDDLGWVREFGFGVFTLSLENFEITGSGTGSGELQGYVSSLSLEAAERLRLEYDSSIEASCMAEAEEAVASLAETISLSIFADATLEIRERSEADPRYANALRSYADCMAAGGYPSFGSPQEVVAAVDNEFGAWLRSVTFSPDSATDAEFVSQLDEPSRDLLSENREWEVALAIQSYECELPVRSDLVEILGEAEQAWIAVNQERLAP